MNSEYFEGFDLELEPLTSFLDEDWIEVGDFEKRAKERATASFFTVENKEYYGPAAVPKTGKLQIGSKEVNIHFEGSFETQLNSNISGGRQLFSAFNGISSTADANENWTQLGYNELLIEGATVYNIAVGGKYMKNGIISSHIIEMDFHCNENGGIS